jgi:hypothetical protein
MSPSDLTDDEKAALVDLLAGVIESDRFRCRRRFSCCAASWRRSGTRDTGARGRQTAERG